MDLFPLARRVLLTAYADTDAAIQAINVVDLDHYLLKPWDPPEEKLYPVVDGLLEAWTSVDHRPARETRVVGHRWSARSYEVRDFLARNSVPYRWYLGRRPGGGAAARRRRPGRRHGCPWWSPRTATRWSSRPTPSWPTGSGCPPPRRTTSTTWSSSAAARPGSAPRSTARREGLRTVLVERRATGGQAGQSSRIENYLGFPDGVSGAQLTERARRQALKFGAEMLTARDVVGLEQRRLGPGGPLRRRHRARRAHGDPGDRRVVPAAGGAGARRPGRPRRLLRRRPPPRRPTAAARTSTSSAAPTRPGRRRCTSRRHARKVRAAGARRLAGARRCRAT